MDVDGAAFSASGTASALPMASSVLLMKVSSETAPMNWVVSLMTVLGTPITRYFWAIWGNSCTSTTSALILSFSIAIIWATRATEGQWGQVGVTNTWMWMSSSTSCSFLRVSALRDVLGLDSSIAPSMMVTNS